MGSVICFDVIQRDVLHGAGQSPHRVGKWMIGPVKNGVYRPARQTLGRLAALHQPFDGL